MASWRLWYGFLAKHVRRRGARFSCMNWGYAEEGPAAPSPVHAHPERYPLQLYEAVVAGSALADRTVVDVSCGRGGGLAWLQQRYGPARAIGIDLVPGNLDACRASFAAPGLTFREGSAEALPLRDGEAGVLLSVEASHCYASIERFLAEAHRALEPGGRLLWADFVPTAELPARRALALRRFRLLEERDITANVLLAMRLDAARRVELVRRHGSPLLQKPLLKFAAAGEEQRTYQDLATGRRRYFLFRLERDAR